MLNGNLSEADSITGHLEVRYKQCYFFFKKKKRTFRNTQSDPKFGRGWGVQELHKISKELLAVTR
jgi:hypothetical protein